MYTSTRLLNLLLPVLAAHLWAPTPVWAGRADQASMIVNYFGASCPSQGEWTRAAMAQANSLLEVMRSVQNDPDCVTASGAMSQLSVMNSKLMDIMMNREERELHSLKKQEQDLLLQLATAQSGSLSETLVNQQLISVRVQIAQYTGYKDYNESQGLDMRSTLQSLVTSANVLMRQAGANTSCMVKHPSLLSGIASLAGSVASSAVTSGISLGIAAGVDLLGIVLENARKWRINHRINKVGDVILANGFQCVLESLSNQWCSAQDAMNVIKLKASAAPVEAPQHPMLVGVRLLDREAPNLMRWLERVRSGADATSLAMADRQTRVLEREKLVRSARAQGLGLIEENRALFENIRSDNAERDLRDRWGIVRTTITDMISKFGGGMGGYMIPGGNNISNPLFEVHDSDYAPYYLMGLTYEQTPKFTAGGSAILKPFNQFQPLTEWRQITGRPFTPDLNVISSRLTLWIQEAQGRVNNELSVVLNPDPLEIISSAAIRNQFGFVPYDSLTALADFLNSQRPSSFVVGSHRRLYDDTVKRLRDIQTKIRVIVESTAPVPTDPNDPNHPRAVLADIYRIGSLDFGTVLLGNRLETSIRLALTELLTSGRSGLSSESAARLLAAEDTLQELRRYSGTDDLNLIARDIERSQATVTRTMTVFLDLFGNGIERTLHRYSRAGDQANSKERAELCLKLLAAPEWERSISFRRYCEGAQLVSVFNQGPASIVVDRESLSLPYEQRACAYRNYLRANRIYQNYLQTPSY